MRDQYEDQYDPCRRTTNDASKNRGLDGGEYRVTGLEPASYDVSSTASGFATAIQKGVVINVGQVVTLDFRLKETGVKVRIPRSLPRLWCDRVRVREVFQNLVGQYPGLRGNLLDDAGGLHKFVNVYKDDDDIRYLEGLDTKVSEGDVVSILPAVAGGSS